jgi:hypothetical protein
VSRLFWLPAVVLVGSFAAAAALVRLAFALWPAPAELP